MRLKRIVLLFVILAVVGISAASTNPQRVEAVARPNILFILTDDLDLNTDSRMENLDTLVKRRGTTFKNAFVTTSQCCPSRVSILTGKYVHNHDIRTNTGASDKFRSSGEDRFTVAQWLHQRDYKTIFLGKYLNGYNDTYAPPGWEVWEAQTDSKTTLNVNGTIERFGTEVHETDLLGERALRYIRNADEQGPFFMYLSLNAPHYPDEGAPRHEGRYTGTVLPRPPNFNEADVSDKPGFIRGHSPLTPTDVQNITERYRDRLRSMLTVDEWIGRLVNELRASGELDNTYIVFTSDNGYHLGQHRLPFDKGRPYEEDIRIPLYIRGPGVPEGRTLNHTVLNIDFAPTLAELGGAEIPGGRDGRSFAPLLRDAPLPAVLSWRESFLVEFFHTRTYSAMHSTGFSYVEYDNGEKELYDLLKDPYQLRSLHRSPEHRGLMSRFHDDLERLKNCSGQESCKAAEQIVFTP